MRIVASVKEGDTEWTQTTVLRVALLEITEALGKKFNRNVFVIAQQMLLCSRARGVDE